MWEKKLTRRVWLNTESNSSAHSDGDFLGSNDPTFIGGTGDQFRAGPVDDRDGNHVICHFE